jgi:AAA+ superfamily predicted ATPase
MVFFLILRVIKKKVEEIDRVRMDWVPDTFLFSGGPQLGLASLSRVLASIVCQSLNQLTDASLNWRVVVVVVGSFH